MKERTVERSQPLSPVVGKVSFATQNRNSRHAAAVGNVVPDALQRRGTSTARLNVEIARHTDGNVAFVHAPALAGPHHRHHHVASAKTKYALVPPQAGVLEAEPVAQGLAERTRPGSDAQDWQVGGVPTQAASSACVLTKPSRLRFHFVRLPVPV